MYKMTQFIQPSCDTCILSLNLRTWTRRLRLCLVLLAHIILPTLLREKVLLLATVGTARKHILRHTEADSY